MKKNFTTQRPATNRQIIRALKEDSVFGPVVECLRSRKFHDPCQEVAEDEVVVGYLTDLQKALYTERIRAINENDALTERLLSNLLINSIEKTIPEAEVNGMFSVRNAYAIVVPDLEKKILEFLFG